MPTPPATTDDDRPKVAKITGSSVPEGQDLTFQVDLSNPSKTDTPVTLKLTNGTATVGTDTGTPILVDLGDGKGFVPVTLKADGTIDVVVPAGSTGLTLKVPTVTDGTSEGAETIKLTATTPTDVANATTPQEGTGTIEDNSQPLLNINDVEVNEAAGTATFTVTLSNPSTSAVTVNYATQDGTGATGAVGSTTPGVGDFDAITGQISFAPGETSKTVTVKINNDGTFEGVENYTVVLSGASNALIGDGSGLGGINDQGGPTAPPPGPNVPPVTPDDDRPQVASVSNASVTEGVALNFAVALTTVSTTPTSVVVKLTGVNASVGTDTGTPIEAVFANGTKATVTVDASGNATVSVPAGQSGFTLTVPTVDDVLTESTETLTLSANVTGGPVKSGTGTILDNDAPPTLDLDGNNSSGQTGNNYVTTFTENGTGVPVGDVDVLITDVDSSNLKGAIVRLNNPQAGDQLLVGPLPSGITATVLGSVVTLSGSASAADYQAAIRAVSFVNTSDAPAVVDRTIEVTVSDGTSNSPVAITTVKVVAVNDAPTVAAGSSSVSEEGLAGGVADANGTNDTTNAKSVTGKMVATDPDGTTPSGWTLDAPPATVPPLTSGGAAVTWSGNGTASLTATAGGQTVATLTIDNAGNYTFNLLKPLDHPQTNGEDVLPLNFKATVSDGTLTGSNTLTINVEDDSPAPLPPVAENVTVTVSDTNLMFILDVSSSMNKTDGVNGQTRFASMIQSVENLIDSYFEVGDVRVRLVTFGTDAQSLGSGWLTVPEAKALLEAIPVPTSNTQGTNYDAALGTAISAFANGATPDTSKLATGANVSYFISDGLPTYGIGTQSQLTGGTLNGNGIVDTINSGDEGIQANEFNTWSSHLFNNSISSYSLGVGADISPTERAVLDPIAYDGRAGEDRSAVVVADFADLDAVLSNYTPKPTTGNLISGSLLPAGGVGADSGVYVSDVVYGGVTYSYNKATGFSFSGGTSAATYDAATRLAIISVEVSKGVFDDFRINFETGEYSINFSSANPTTVGFSIADADGDKVSSTIQIDPVRVNIVNGGATAELFNGLNTDDLIRGLDGNDTILGNDGDDQLYGGLGNDVVNGGSGDDFIYGGNGDDTMIGGDGNDTFYGADGVDIYTGGAGSDVFVFTLNEQGATSTNRYINQITDFNAAPAASGGDILDLRDLLEGENTVGGAGNLQKYLDFAVATNPDGSFTTTIRVSPTGGFTTLFGGDGTYVASADTQRMVLDGVNIRTALGLANTATDSQIIAKLLQNGSLLVDNT